MKNGWVNLGFLIVVASAMIWLGAELTQRIEWILPYTAAVGALLIVVGFVTDRRLYRPSVTNEPNSKQ
jgi:uncharacterized membrane protein